MKTLKDLLVHQVKDLYSAESQLIEALPKVAKSASSPKLRKTIESHLEETKKHKERLEKVGKMLNVDISGETCKAMKGLISESESFLSENMDSDVKDAGIIAESQRVEHYEISAYGTACHYAAMLDLDDIKKMLGETLEEEKDADEKLNDLAIEKLNQKAMA